MGAFIPYPAIEHHGVVGDRRTAALVASDGTVDWLCLPDYDRHVVFGALLDANRGGFWRVGPSTLWAGAQSYPTAAPFVRTTWSTAEYELELLDAMLLPHDRAGADADRVLLRRLSCTRGRADCVSIFSPRFDFDPLTGGVEGRFPSGEPFVRWCSDEAFRPASAGRRLESGDVVWMAFALGRTSGWSVAEAERLLKEADRFWTNAAAQLGGADDRTRRSAITIRLLEYAPSGSIVAAPTTSLPERIGGSWNADYRLTWVRDASLSMATLARLGDVASARRFFTWLSTLGSTTDAPLQVTYEIRGGTTPRQRDVRDVEGYRASPPVRFGNHAYCQHQHDKFGYLAQCALEYLECGGRWEPRFWQLLVRLADYVAAHWEDPGNGIWELPSVQHYISSRVMSWATLDRVLRIAERLGTTGPRAVEWRRTKDRIFSSVLQAGWSDTLGAFRQSLEVEGLDASVLLIPIVGLLPPEDRRVVSTVERIAERLTIDGCVYRFDPQQVPGLHESPLGQYEAAFLPCTFWLATAFALLGRRNDAEDILRQVERVAGPLGLFAEGLDPRAHAFCGNAPLLFSHVEYVRAVRTLQM